MGTVSRGGRRQLPRKGTRILKQNRCAFWINHARVTKRSKCKRRLLHAILLMTASLLFSGPAFSQLNPAQRNQPGSSQTPTAPLPSQQSSQSSTMQQRSLPRSPITAAQQVDRKSTRLNSSHTVISYAVFCLKEKTEKAGVRGRVYAAE